MAEMTFRQILQAAHQLPPDQQDELIRQLQAAKQQGLSAQEKRARLQSMIIHMDMWPEDWSLNREDWYSDHAL